MKAALARHDALLRTGIETNQGYAFKTFGDAFCAAFANPHNALNAALSVQLALQSESWPAEIGLLRVRMALHTGIAEERDGDYFGPPLNRTARLLAAGHGGQTLFSLATQELVRDQLPEGASLLDLGEHRLKDLFRPERVYQLIAPGLPAQFPPLRTLDAKPTNLPSQPTPLIGREREVEAVLSLLRRTDVRLVTLTGPGGTGKTRLSLQVAADLVDEYEQGVYFIALASISDYQMVIPTIAATLGMKESGDQPVAEALSYALREKHMLLMLDNFEQVVKAAPRVGDLLAAAPKLKIIVTSREVLRLRGEYDFPVPPLALPHRHLNQTVAALSQYESVALFIQCAKAVRGDFEITEDNASAVVEICVRLDGLPLAIELAAARSRMLPPKAMLEKLSSRLKALTGGARDLPARQQTLRSTIDWSYDLLEDPEKKLFARLGAFQGGRTAEAVEAVCGPGLDLDVIDGLESLLNKSLLRQETGPHGQPRFVILETIHEYARERLKASGEAEAIRRRHAEYFTTWVEGIQQELRGGPAQLEWFKRFETEQGNFRSALEWSLDGVDVELGLRLVGAIWPFWWRQGYYVEGQHWASRALQGSDAAAPARRAEVLLALGEMCYSNQNLPDAKRYVAEAVSIYRTLKEDYNTGWALLIMGNVLIFTPGENERGMAVTQEGLALVRKLGDKPGIQYGLNILGESERAKGHYEQAKAYYTACLEVAIDIGDKLRQLMQYQNLGAIARHSGDYKQAEILINRGTALAFEIDNKLQISDGLSMVADVIALLGHPRRAARLIGAGEALHESIGLKLQPNEQAEHDRGVVLVREQLGDEAFEALRSEGRALSLDEAVKYALNESDND
jgi:predicted ATPase